MIKFKLFCLILFSVSGFQFFSNSALAVGIGVEPSFLDFELKIGQIKTGKILVYNISQEPGIFQVFPDDLNDWLKIEPNNFRLEAGENKEVKIEIKAKEKGRRATNFSVVSLPLDRRSFSISPGLKIPLRLNIKEESPIFLASVVAAVFQGWNWLLLGILVIYLIGFFLVKCFKRRKKVIAPPENLPVEKL